VADRQPDVFVLLIDTLRADVLTRSEYAAATSNLRGLAGTGLVAADAMATTTWTRSSVASLFTGLDPAVHGTHGRNDVLAESVATLAERFRARGYRTIGAIANPNVGAQWGFDQGFDEYLRAAPRAAVDGDRRPATAAQVYAAALARIDVEDARERPLFVYLHTVDPHAPYDPPEWLLDEERPAGAVLPQDLNLWNKNATAAELTRAELLYRGEVAYADRELGRLLAALNTRGRLNNALVVVTSDHGEQFAEHGQFGHGLTLFQQELAVPLIFSGARIAGGQRLEAPVSLRDLAPTIASFAGLAGINLGGVDLLAAAPPADRDLVADLRLDGREWRGLRRGPLKLVGDQRQELPWLFDLSSDPGELTDMFATTREARPMRRQLRDLLAALEAQVIIDGESSPEIDEETRAQLRALGYIQ
jgi:arylsulfatase A-like enzyme